MWVVGCGLSVVGMPGKRRSSKVFNGVGTVGC